MNKQVVHFSSSRNISRNDMKLCYLNILWTKDAGVLRKLSHQIRALRTALTKQEAAECLVVVRDDTQGSVVPLPDVSLFPVRVPGSPIVQEALLPFLVWPKLEKRLSNFDAIVTRWTIPSPSFLAVAKKKAVFTEHHTKELEETSLAQGLKPFARTLLEKRYAPPILREARGIIGVTDEIRKYELDRAGIDRPSMVLSNGISPEDVPFSPPPAFDGHSLDVAFVSSHFAPWHGLDRMLRGLQQYKGRVRVTLHLIGRVSPGQQAEIPRMGLDHMVAVHGFRQGKDLEAVISSCHLAIGSLALHRNGLKEACVLKVREYTARGLPFVIAYDDPDFTRGIPWVLNISSDDSPVEIDEIISFAERLSAFPSIAREMRTYAEERLSWTVKMKGLLGFVRENL